VSGTSTPDRLNLPLFAEKIGEGHDEQREP